MQKKLKDSSIPNTSTTTKRIGERNHKPNQPLISVIVPVYNTQEYLDNCLRSITSQTYDNLEIICINDGSTDDSATIIQSYADTDQRIKIITQKNSGLSGARNTGVKNATGKYITFVDSDDYIELHMIENLYEALIGSNAEVAICSFKEIYPNGKTRGFSRNHSKQIFTTDQALANMLQENGFMVSATMKLFPTTFLKNIKFPVGVLHEDVGTTYKIIMKAKKIVFIPNEDYVYVHHDDSIINQHFDDRKLSLIKLTDQMCDEIDRHYPNLQNFTNERRMRARFSILRQIPLNHSKAKEIVDYLKKHKGLITNNPAATKTDKLALRLALINPKLFQIAYDLRTRL